MLRIKCPSCGERDETEFRYRGDASVARPRFDAAATAGSADTAAAVARSDIERFSAFVYERANPHGWHVEWWLHVGGCRRLLRVVRHTFTHEIRFVGAPLDSPAVPAAPAAASALADAAPRGGGPASAAPASASLSTAAPRAAEPQ